MDFGEIPDDIWISIFEQIDDDPSTLAVLVRTCRRFHGLASKLLLRELKWFKPELTLRNIEAWAGVYSTLVALPRKITIGIPFEFAHVLRLPSIPNPSTLSAEMKLHDLIYTQLLRFTSITEICFDGTVISPYSYSVLGEIPTLRSLRLANCTFINLHVSFGTRANNHSLSHLFDPDMNPSLTPQEPTCPLEAISLVPIKHLSLHRVIVAPEYENYRYHPLSLITISTLTSLSITWNSNISARYAQNRCALHSLTQLSVVMPLMSRDLLDELATFVHRCDLSPRFKLRIDKHNLSDTQMATVQVPSTGLWKYEGPLVIVAASSTKSLRPTLTHVKINETLELPLLLDGLEKLPMVMQELEVQVGKWDIELLFAIKELFKKIKKLEVRYARGGLPENLLVRLGADILFCLPDLVSIKLLGPKPLEDAIAERPSTFIRSTGSSNSSRISSLRTGANSSNTSSVHSRGPVELLHDVLMSGGSDYNDDRDLDFNAEDFEGALFDREQDQVRTPGGGGSLNVQVGSSSRSKGFSSSSSSSSSSSFQSNRSGGVLNWNPSGPSLRHSSSALPSLNTPGPSSAFSTFPTTSSSNTRRSGGGGGFAKRQEALKSESASPLSQAELGDYLIGWSRYCPSLRVVQIDHRWWWERRFVGDPWILHVTKSNSSNSSEKGKEREGSFA